MENYVFRTKKGGFILRIVMLVCMALAVPVNALAQTEVTVLSSDLKPLEGASVSQKGTGEGVVTAATGVAALSIDQATVFIVSYVGFEDSEFFIRPGEKKQVILLESSQALSAVQVEGFLGDRPLNRQAGGIAKIDLTAFQRFGENSLVQAINTIPGVRFEQRAGASYRVSIRGSSVRSPFGVRNVKVYWNGIPFTEPGGNTFINLLDLANVSDVEIIKGPAASIYGAGNGGVMKLNSTNLAAMANSTSISSTFGSFGFFRQTASYNSLKRNSSITIKAAHQQREGYREHNEMKRTVFEVDGLFFPDKRRTVSTAFLFSSLDYQIPGGLNPDQRDEDPRQPRPGSVERNASIDNQLFLAKIGHEYDFGAGLTNKTNLGLSFNQFENPFNLDYKKDNQQVLSVRSEFQKHLKLGEQQVELSFGTEYQSSFFDGKNFGNVAGQADTIRFADEVKARQSTTFLNTRVPLGKTVDLTAGVSLNTLVYDIDRLIDRINNNPQAFQKSFDAVWSQRLAVSKQINDKYSLHFSWSTGFSPPTTTEVRTNNGGLNTTLQGEKGTNYELNFRGQVGRGLSFDLALFSFTLEDAITTITDRRGVQLFRNAGETSQNGLELQLRNEWLTEPTGAISRLSSGLAYTYHNFEYQNYVDSGDDFSGNQLPGTAPHVVNLTTDLALKNGLYLNLTYHYSDPIPLNDENTFFSEAYNLMNLRAGYQGKIKDRTNFELFFGVENLFDVSYSLGNDLNAFGRRYFQPAAGINYFFGLKLKLSH